MTWTSWLSPDLWATPVADHLWQSTAVAAGVWLLTIAFKNSRAEVRYRLWLLASAKFLLPFALITSVVGWIGWQPPLAIGTPAFTYALDVASGPFSRADVPGLASSAARSGGPATVLPIVVLVAWCAGCAAMLTAWRVSWVRVARLVRTGSPVLAGPEWTMLRRIERRVGVTDPLPLVSLDTSLEPGVFGVLRPILLWPRSLSSRLDARQLEAILAHELCHVRRSDNLTLAVHALVKACFWFHPMVWWIGRRLDAERERACDQAVLAFGCDARTYAESILTTCMFYLGAPRDSVAGVSGSNLTPRIERIMKQDSGRRLSAWHFVLLVAASVLAVLPIATSLASPRLRAQAPATADGPAFEVASIKPNADPDGPRLFQALPGGRVNLVNQTARELIYSAYQTQDYQIIGGPAWLAEDRFDVVAKAPTAAPPGQMLQMVRTLLADRFGLTMHTETRELPIYVLVMAGSDRRPGPQLKTSACVPTDGTGTPNTSGPPPCGNRGGAGLISSAGITLDALANRLGRLAPIGRPVVNQTGLTGQFDVELRFTPDQPGAPPPPDAISVFTAVREQLGLRLEPSRGPVEVFVIDRVERPSPD